MFVIYQTKAHTNSYLVTLCIPIDKSLLTERVNLVLGRMDIFKFGTSEYATPVGILIKAGTDPSLIQPGVTENLTVMYYLCYV